MEQSKSELATQHETLWLRFQQGRTRHPQASLFIGAAHNNLVEFTNRVARALLCNALSVPCDQCQSCRLALAGENPDIVTISQDKPGTMIKIDQIRELQQGIYTTAQLGEKKIVIINPADKMNVAAANALLKILEEPPVHVYFLLIAEQLSTVLPTIISRCQQWRFCERDFFIFESLQHYDPQSRRGEIIGKREEILQDLHQIQTGILSPSSVAAKWSKLHFDELIWFFYLIVADIIGHRLCAIAQPEKSDLIQRLALNAEPVHLFKLLDILHPLIKSINLGTSVNQVLALEEVLYGFIRKIT